MLAYINIYNILKNTVILHIFHKLIELYPELKKYDKNISFNMYRSLMCLTFTILSFYCFIKYIHMGYTFPFEYHTEEFTEIQELFLGYILYDLFVMIKTKSGRTDLYIHHIFVSVVLIIYIVNGYGGWLMSLLIFSEIVSIVSGIDVIAIKDGNMRESMIYKKIRKNIIKFLRLPIWIIFFLFNTKYIGRLPKYIIYIGYISFFIMLGLDRYWEKKCDKVIHKYKSK